MGRDMRVRRLVSKGLCRHPGMEYMCVCCVWSSRNGLYPLGLVISLTKFKLSKRFLSAFLYVKYISLLTELITGHKLKRQEKAYLKDIWTKEDDAWNRYVLRTSGLLGNGQA